MGALEYWTESHGPMAGYMECILELAQKEVLLRAACWDKRRARPRDCNIE